LSALPRLRPLEQRPRIEVGHAFGDLAVAEGVAVGADLDDPARRTVIRDAVTRVLDGAARAKAAA
jgi:hypothetical protein